MSGAAVVEFSRTFASPVGLIHLRADPCGRVIGLRVGGDAPASDPGAATPWVGTTAAPADVGASLDGVVHQLTEYFDGSRTEFDVPVLLKGTSFQQRVWAILRAVPYGATTTYGTLAARLGTPRAARAVGNANARNPIAIIVPCHRVIGSGGALTGYGGGVDVKRFLLDLERGRRGNRRATATRLPVDVVSHRCG